MSTTNLLALLSAYLWIQGGLGWAEWHEVKHGLKLTVLGKLVIVLASPFFTGVSIVATILQEANLHLAQPLRDAWNRRKGIGR